MLKLTPFSEAVVAFRLNEEEQMMAKAIGAEMKITLEDTAIQQICMYVKTHSYLLEAVDGFKAATVEARAFLETAAKETNETFVKTGRQLLANVETRVGAAMEKQIAAAPAMLESAMLKTADKHVDLIERVSIRRHTFRLSAVGCLALVGLVLAGGLGYVIGRDTLTADAASWAAIMNLPDGPKWLEIIRNNQDIGKLLAQFCGPGQGVVISGAKVCNLRLFMTAPVASSEGINMVWVSLAETANNLGWRGYGLVGAACGFVGWLFGRGKRTY